MKEQSPKIIDIVSYPLKNGRKWVSHIVCSLFQVIKHISTGLYVYELTSYMLSFGNANVGDLYVNRRVSGKTAFYT